MSNLQSGRALGLGLIVTGVVAACGRGGDPPPPVVPPDTASAAATSAPDTTPKAADVFKDGAAPKAAAGDPKAGSLEPMTREQESRSMPLPGQANDHSSPAAQPAKRETR
jgi:hypothetical protein